MRSLVALALALVVLSTLAVSPSALAHSGPSDHYDGFTPSEHHAFAVDEPPEEEQLTLRIDLTSTGDARWTVELTYLLETEDDREAFNRLAEEFEEGDSDVGFTVETFERVAERSSDDLGRDMTIGGVDRSSTTSNDTGTLTLSFTWTGFAETDGNNVVIGDVFDVDPWLPSLGENQRLVIAAPGGYAVQSATTSIEDGTLRWDGPHEFEPGDIRAQFVPRSDLSEPPSAPETLEVTNVTHEAVRITWSASDGDVDGYEVFRNGEQIDTTTDLEYTDTGLDADTEYEYTVRAYNDAGTSAHSDPVVVTTEGRGNDDGTGVGSPLPGNGLFILAVILGTVLLTASYVAFRNGYGRTLVDPVFASAGREAETEEPDSASVAPERPETESMSEEDPSDPDTARETPDPTPDDPFAGVDVDLLSDEERVVRLLDANGGRMKQGAIVEETKWSNAKVSQLLSSMADEGTVEKLRIGRENLITHVVDEE